MNIPKKVNTSCKLKKDRQSNGQKNNDKRTNNDLQNTTQKTKYRATRTSLKSNNDLQNTTQTTKDQATRTSLKQTMIYKTLHRKLKIEQHEPH